LPYPEPLSDSGGGQAKLSYEKVAEDASSRHTVGIFAWKKNFLRTEIEDFGHMR
jgi:hypothetical protein